MIEVVLNQISAYINQELPFLSKPCGVVRLQKERVEKKIKSYPVTRNLDPNTCNSQPYIAMIPDSTSNAIAYFEVQSNKSDVEKLNKNTASVRLVCWYNRKQLISYTEGALEGAFMRAIGKSQGEITQAVDGLRIGNIDFKGYLPKSSNLFAQYTYDETETQYLMLPFDYFAIQFEISYHFNPSCAQQIIFSQITKC